MAGPGQSVASVQWAPTCLILSELLQLCFELCFGLCCSCLLLPAAGRCGLGLGLGLLGAPALCLCLLQLGAQGQGRVPGRPQLGSQLLELGLPRTQATPPTKEAPEVLLHKTGPSTPPGCNRQGR